MDCNYPPCTVVAEKFEVLVRLDAQDTRMKGYFDVEHLLKSEPPDRELLSNAIRTTIKRRGSDLPAGVPTGLTEEFARETQVMWNMFLRENSRVVTFLARMFSAGICGEDLMVRAHPMRKLLFLVIIGVAVYAGLTQYRQASADTRESSGVVVADDSAFTRALENRASGVQLQGHGAVIKVLPNDNVGSRHQRFLLKLQSGQTLLIAHNIDIASSISSLRVGDNVSFNGEYEWNSAGGVIHWTHRDPGGRHVAGWLKHGGRIYQ
jgi:hypothetical protein